MRRTLPVLAVSVLIALSIPVSAQIAAKTGSIYGRVLDESKAPIAGVEVQLESAVIPSQQATTGPSGSFRFATLPPAAYVVTVRKRGFTNVRQEDIRVSVGSSVELQVKMTSAVVEQVNVVGSPLVNTSETAVASTYSQEYLQDVPVGRDPWFVINMTPGVDSDRFNTGSEAGQKAFFFARGGNSSNNVWSYDGVTNTSIIQLGQSPTFYDFDAFEEIQISTASNDASIQTGGVAVNLVTKRGGNQWEGTASVYFTNDHLQSTNTPEELKDSPGSNRISKNLDYGFNLGGPIVKDKFFVWGGIRKSQINLLSIENLPDDTELTDYNLKFNLDWNSANESQFGLFKGLRNKSGWAPFGADVQAPETLWELSTKPKEGIWTAQHTWIPNDHLLVVARYGYIGEAATLLPAGGGDVPMIYLAAIPRWESTLNVVDVDSSAHDINADVNFFKEEWLGGDHEFKFGFEYKGTTLRIFSSYGNGVYITDYYQTQAGGPLTSGLLNAQHVLDGHSNLSRLSFYITDTYRRDRLTLNLGLRFDHQTGVNKPGSIPAVPGYEQFVPGFDYAGGDPGITFNNVSPRLGATYDLTGDGKTLIRGNFARYYDAFDPLFVTYSNPTFTYIGARFEYVNRNGDREITPDEIVGDPLYYHGLNPGPFDLNSFLAARHYDPNLSSGWTNEYVVGVERELTANTAVSVNYIQRKYGNLTTFVPFGVSTADFVPAGIFTASTVLGNFTVPYYMLGFVQDGSGNLTNIKDYHQTYRGVDVLIRKRMSHNFTLNGGFTIQRQTEHYDGGDSLGFLTANNFVFGLYAFDPTNLPFLNNRVYSYSGLGFGKEALNPFSEWNLKLSGTYQFRWDIIAGAYLRYQQGYPFILTGAIRGDSTLAAYYVRPHRILVEPLGSRRLDNVFTLDLHIEKGFNFASGRLTGILDIFNLTNANTILSRNPSVNSEIFNAIVEVLSPRAFRLGLSYGF